ncbi:MAG: hypothetical protein ACHQFW_00245 [Chitinophagales bacterium]
MNFLSHFYNETPCEDPYFAAGVILPDILSNYSGRSGELVKLHPNKLADSRLPQINSLINGVKRHYAVDEYFHGSQFFQKNTAEISLEIKKRDFKCFDKRLYAVSHVFLELMLDRKLLIQEKWSCDLMYFLLDKVDLSFINQFIRDNTGASDPSKPAQFFNRFRTIKFVYDYTDDSRLGELINSINQRLGNPPFQNEDKSQFTLTIHDIENIILPQKFPKFPTDS